jgi:hypothetical protein
MFWFDQRRNIVESNAGAAMHADVCFMLLSNSCILSWLLDGAGRRLLPA